MRILSLCLDRYGPFTGRRLDFPQSAPLTVIHGANEAGKSSALAALADGLFGIPMQASAAAFLHPYAALRIGMELMAADGRRVAFRRRKAQRGSLVSADEAERPLADDLLAPFTGHVTRSVFLDAFGLNAARLRLGTQLLLDGKGAIGEALLAAAPGLEPMTALRRRLAEEARVLFPADKRVASARFYEILDAAEEARREIARTLVSADRHGEVVRAARAAEALVESLSARRTQLRREDAARARLVAGLPRLSAIDALLDEIGQAGDRPPLTEEEARRAVADEAALATAELGLAGLAREEQALTDSLAALTLDTRLDDLEQEGQRLLARRALREDAADRLIRVAARATAAEATVREIARRLGLPSAAALAALGPDPARLDDLRALLAERAARAQARRLAEEARDQALVRAGELGRLAARLPRGSEHRRERAILDGLAGLGAAEAALSAALARLAQAGSEQAGAATAAGLDDDRGGPLPAVADDLEDRLEAWRLHDAELAESERRLAEAREALDGAEARLSRLSAGDLPATPEAVGLARNRRETAFASLQALLPDGRASQNERMAAADTLAAAIRHADDLVDRRVAEARRVAEILAATADRDAAATLVTRVREVRDACRTAVDDDARERARLADALNLDARAGPAVLRARLEARRRYGEATGRVAVARAEEMRAREIFDALRADLGALAHRIGVDAANLSPLTLAAVCREEIERAQTAFAAWREADHQNREAAEDAARAGERAEAEALALAELDRRIAAGAEALSLPGGGSGSAVAAALAGLAEAETPLAAEAAARAEADQLAGFISAFDQDIAALARRAGLEGDGDPLALADRLELRLAGHRRDRSSEAGARERLAGLAARRAEIVLERDAAAARLSALRRRLALGADDPLAPALAACRRQAMALEELATERRRLKAETGLDEAELRLEARGIDRDGLLARQAEAAAELRALDEAVDQAIAERTTTAAALAALGAAGGAEAVAQRRENLLSDLAEVVDEWRVLNAAIRLVDQTVETYRREHQNPVLERARGWFSRLTGGRYTDLVADVHETGRPMLAIQRGSERLALQDLSEGTADQLFLALRLATLADHAARTEPMPFIGDDLFMTFDETRTAAGLSVLAEFGRTTQAVLFTHHRHVADLARDLAGEGVAVLSLDP